jgi:hypothetical protein
MAGPGRLGMARVAAQARNVLEGGSEKNFAKSLK